jgi:hypothetical protein
LSRRSAWTCGGANSQAFTNKGCILHFHDGRSEVVGRIEWICN